MRCGGVTSANARACFAFGALPYLCPAKLPAERGRGRVQNMKKFTWDKNKSGLLFDSRWRMNIGRHCLTLSIVLLSSCKPDLSDDPIPEAIFSDIRLNLFLPEYNSLRNDGGTFSIPDKGVRGIFVYRKNSTIYFAYERNCSFQPADACATIDIHSSNLFMIDSCCSSSFDFEDGSPTGGPAWRPLRKYRTYLTGNELTIVAESLNGM